ncbi:PKD-like family lipoprotein [Chitinophaga polysaccharea]|uniref:PKD-like family lipoprotein n=1 Tax=Chitinophaga polysaccharea TaxID=1293035 RepID=UPI00163BE69F|nr:PKD-like family lipoprotein [Chitinophaga polysaccharea]
MTRLLLILGVYGLAISCQKDKGNYIYHDINEITINDLDSIYYVFNGDPLRISPRLVFSKDAQPDTANYRYEWFQGLEKGFTGWRPQLIFSGLNIDTVLNMDLGTTQMYFRVTDKRTGIYTLKPFLLSIYNKAYMGWLVLSDVNGEARLDMLSTYKAENRLYKNILDTMHSDVKLSGAPVSVGFLRYNGMSDGGMFYNVIVTSEGGWITNRDELKNLPEAGFDQLVPGNPPSYDKASLEYSIFHVDMYNNGNVYHKGYWDDRFVGPVNNLEEITDNNSPGRAVRYKAAPYFAGAADNVMILFNSENKKFYRYPGSGTLTFPLEMPGVQQRGLDLVYMTYISYNGGEAVAILKDTASLKHYLLRFTADGKTNYYAEMPAEEIGQATQFAVSPVTGYIFYESGSKLYEYDFDLKQSFKMLDLDGETISKIAFHKFQQPDANITPYAAMYLEMERDLIVCTYKNSNPSNTGKLSIYKVPDGNKPLEPRQFFEGFGKIVSFTFRER